MKQKLAHTLLNAGYNGDEIVSIMQHIPEEEMKCEFHHNDEDILNAINLSYKESKEMFEILTSFEDSDKKTKLSEQLVTLLSRKQLILFLSLSFTQIDAISMVASTISLLKNNSNLVMEEPPLEKLDFLEEDVRKTIGKTMVRFNIKQAIVGAGKIILKGDQEMHNIFEPFIPVSSILNKRLKITVEDNIAIIQTIEKKLTHQETVAIYG